MTPAAPFLPVDGRHVPDGRGGHVHSAYWLAATTLALAILSGMSLGQPAAIAAATIVFIGGGLPHGAYDIALLRRTVILDRAGMMMAIGGYVAVAVAMALLWTTLPLVALILFLGIACVHFGEDWDMIGEPLLRVAAGAAIIAAPTIGHPADVARLFVALSDARGAVLAQIVTAAAPVVLLVTTVGIATAWQVGNRPWAIAMTSCLVLLLVAPPVAGFALFFVFLHSPRHLAHTRSALGDMTRIRWIVTGGLVSAAALIGWWLLQRLTLAPVEGDLTTGAFRLLASVAVPHLLLSRWAARRLDQHLPTSDMSVSAA